MLKQCQTSVVHKSRHQRPVTYVIDLGITLTIGVAIRLVHQQDARGTGIHDANGGDLNDANITCSSDTVTKPGIFFC